MRNTLEELKFVVFDLILKFFFLLKVPETFWPFFVVLISSVLSQLYLFSFVKDLCLNFFIFFLLAVIKNVEENQLEKVKSWESKNKGRDFLV